MRACLLFLCLVVTLGCGEGGDADDDNWIGTWKVESIDNPADELNDLEELGNMEFTFYDDDTWCLLFDGDKEWGTYSLSGSNFTVITRRQEVSGEIEDVHYLEKGTWSRNGGTLTWTFSDGTVTVLKKKYIERVTP